jgi:hypothetical protein
VLEADFARIPEILGRAAPEPPTAAALEPAPEPAEQLNLF